MFFDKKKIRRTRTRPTFQTELLESRAMFSATEMPAVDDCPVDDIGLDIPAYEKPYGQDDSASDWRQKAKEAWENAEENLENLKESWELFWSDTDDLCTGVNEPGQIPAECFGECYAELDDPDLEDEEEDTKKGKKK